ncbi:hypothetical protein TUM19329_22790 [Legionella antarctica]|uniref:Uncharacterized protein n=1 Tax=Legionella antarctica TaxID=2708020 RepID=A0A6F8T686_9GAMM|nr:hypothetical protein [Legionella antarctica]BCA95918.1 hypothetical protein TUM19329_22790 [Legionella antarctica]
MTIEDLLISLTTYILRYHDSQPKNIPIIPPESNLDLLQEQYRAHALKTLMNRDVHYDEYLTGLIKEGEKDYSGRLPLLFYILNEIKVIKSMVDRTTPFSPNELECYKKQMTRMLIDLRQLVLTIKGTTYNVKYSSIVEDDKEIPEKSISLSGTASYSYLTGHSLCTSGSLLTEEVLKRFNITTTSSDKYIQDIAEEFCKARQNALLVPELLLKIQVLTNLSSSQKESIASLELDLKMKETTIQEQGGSIRALTEQVEKYSTITTKEKFHATEPPEVAETLKWKPNQDEAKVEELQEPSLSPMKPISTIKNGFGNPMMLGYAYGSLFSMHGSRFPQLRAVQNPHPAQQPPTEAPSYTE